MLSSLVLSLSLIGPVFDAVTIGRFVDSMSNLRTGFRTLDIEFVQTQTDSVFKKARSYTGRLLFHRDPNGVVYGMLDLRGDGGTTDRETYLLRGGDLYVLNYSDKTVWRVDLVKPDVLGFAAEYWMGVIWLLDRQEGMKRCVARVLVRENTTLQLGVNTVQRSLFGGQVYPRVFRLVVETSGSNEFPKDSIRELTATWPHGGGTEFVYRVTKWAVNTHDTLTSDSFPNPTKLAGWRVLIPPKKQPAPPK